MRLRAAKIPPFLVDVNPKTLIILVNTQLNIITPMLGNRMRKNYIIKSFSLSFSFLPSGLVNSTHPNVCFIFIHGDVATIKFLCNTHVHKIIQ